MNRENTENVVTMDWENGYVECSAKDNENVTEVNTNVSAWGIGFRA